MSMSTITPNILLHLLPGGECAGVMLLEEEPSETLPMGESEAYARAADQENWKGDFCF